MVSLSSHRFSARRNLVSLPERSSPQIAHRFAVEPFIRSLSVFGQWDRLSSVVCICCRRAAGNEIFFASSGTTRSEEHTSELQSLRHLVCRLLLEKKKKK